MSDLPAHILRHYDHLTLLDAQSLGAAGGMSGARFWKLRCSDRRSAIGDFCLRQWPASHPSLTQLQMIHRVLRQAWINDCDFVATPIARGNIQIIDQIIDQTNDQTIVQHAGHLWELSRWMPGSADRSFCQNSVRLQNAMQSLARFHQAAAQVNLEFGPSSNLTARWQQLVDLPSLCLKFKLELKLPESLPIPHAALRQELEFLRQQFVDRGAHLAVSLISPLSACSGIISQAAIKTPPSWVFPLQPVIRDIWWDHVLFTEDYVTGLIDFGGIQVDSVALDIARLLGSTLGSIAHNRSEWEQGVAAYDAVRKLSPSEIEVIDWLDRSGIVLGSWNWLRWLLVEQRSFSNWDLVFQRVQHHRKRLAGLAAE